MNPSDIHLKFPDQATATFLFVEAGVWLTFTDEDKKVCYSDAPGYLTDVIGLIYKPVEAPVDVGGWHVNMRGQLPDAIKPYKITVTGTPYRVWC
jgi:hypothetical protein